MGPAASTGLRSALHPFPAKPFVKAGKLPAFCRHPRVGKTLLPQRERYFYGQDESKNF
jgi:hypothetical protein